MWFAGVGRDSEYLPNPLLSKTSNRPSVCTFNTFCGAPQGQAGGVLQREMFSCLEGATLGAPIATMSGGLGQEGAGSSAEMQHQKMELGGGEEQGRSCSSAFDGAKGKLSPDVLGRVISPEAELFWSLGFSRAWATQYFWALLEFGSSEAGAL